MKIILTGPGQGKTITAALLAATHVVGVYDADPYRALSEIWRRAERYTSPETLVSPCIVDTRSVDARGRPYLAVIREIRGAWVLVVTSPFLQQVEVARRFAEDVKECGIPVRGVVVSMALGEDEAERVAERVGVALKGWLPLSKELENLLASGKPLKEADGVPPVSDPSLIERVMKLGRELSLQPRRIEWKRDRGGGIFRRLGR